MKKGKVALMITNMIATALVSSVATFILTTTVCQVKTEKYIKENLYPRTAVIKVRLCNSEVCEWKPVLLLWCNGL